MPILATPLAGEQAETALARTIQRRTDPNYVCLIDGLGYSIRPDGLYCYPPERASEAVKIAPSKLRWLALDAIYDGHYTPAQVMSSVTPATPPEWMS
jgi:hypothetical protein